MQKPATKKNTIIFFAFLSSLILGGVLYAMNQPKDIIFTAAITSFNNFIADYPGTPYREEAFYLRFDAAYSYAINSYRNLMQERLQSALEYYQAYKKSYPEGEYMANVDESYQDIQARLKTFN